MEFAEKVKETAAKAGRTVNSWVDCTSARLDVLMLESSRDKMYTRLGELLFCDPAGKSDDPEVAELIRRLKETNDKIAAKKDEIAAACGKRPCPGCGKPLPDGYAFCPYCGRSCDK